MQQKDFLLHYGRQFGTLVGLFVLAVILWILTPHFLTISNLLNIAQQTSINAIIAVGMTFVIITAGIDLSVGSIMAFSGVVLASALNAGIPIPIALLGDWAFLEPPPFAWGAQWVPVANAAYINYPYAISPIGSLLTALQIWGL